MKQRTTTLLFLILALILALRLSAGSPADPEAPLLLGPYAVERVVDGDTLILDLDGQRERVRLIGIDAPESVEDHPERVEPYGPVAAAFVSDLLEGQEVMIELDEELRDRYDRLLAYVYLEEEQLNSLLLALGHARVTLYPPNVRYEREFRALEKEARRQALGLWAPEWQKEEE